MKVDLQVLRFIHVPLSRALTSPHPLVFSTLQGFFHSSWCLAPTCSSSGFLGDVYLRILRNAGCDSGYVFHFSLGLFCASGGSCFACFAEMDYPVNSSFCFRLPRGILLVMGAFTMLPVRVRIVSLVVLALLGVPSWISPRATVTVFRLPRGTLLVMGAYLTTQLTLALLVLRAGLRAIPSLSLLSAVCSGDGFSVVRAAYASSSFTVSYLSFLWSVVQGPEPTKCSVSHSGFDASVGYDR